MKNYTAWIRTAEMSETTEKKLMHNEGDRILCFHGPLMYEAKVKLESKNDVYKIFLFFEDNIITIFLQPPCLMIPCNSFDFLARLLVIQQSDSVV